jgi:NtrC-family two-component system sensor histidine kinase KinB
MKWTLSLRQKLAVLFGALIAIIAGIGVYNVTQVNELGLSVDVILRENYQSVIACEQMKEALERMDSGALFTVMGRRKEGFDLITKNQALFEKALRLELNNLTLPGEGEKASLIRDLFSRYMTVHERLQKTGGGQELWRQLYFSELLPLFQKIKDRADEILRMNQENMVEADLKARRKAQTARQQMVLMLLVTTGVAVVLMVLVGKWILQPIQQLIRSTHEIRRGNLDLVVRADSADEIGQLSEAFNRMAEALRGFRRSNRARLTRIQQATERAFNSLPDVIAILDLDGRVEVATESARSLFGLKPGVFIREIPFPWMAALFHETLRRGYAAGMPGVPPVVQQFDRNEERFYRPQGVPILDEEVQPAGVILILKDVTQQLQQDDLKRGVLSTVSHQLKTPLTSLRMALHLLLEEEVGPLNEKQAELLVAGRDDAERLHFTLTDLLDMSRIESGRVRMDLQPLKPHGLVLEASEPFRSEALGRGLVLTVDLPGDLPEVEADKARIGHVFANLLSNALKYTAPGGKVEVSAEANEESVTFSVSDTGRGIPGPYLARIFEPFFRVPDQGTTAGTGLGLAIVKDIVEAHGGKVLVESEEGKGTAFRFTLRRADRSAKEER